MRGYDWYFGLLLFPHRRQLLRPADAGPDPVQSRLERLAREEGWPVVDLLPHFLDAQRGGDVLLDYWHSSPWGHAATVAAIESPPGTRGHLS